MPQNKMTISVAWVRAVGKSEELVFASDSRLSFGARWDCCPKVLALPRNDAAISFAGETHYAYPVMLQAIAAVAQYPKLLSRGMDLGDLRGHLLRVLNDMLSLVHDLPKGKGVDNTPKTDFLFGGWSWKSSRFRLWRLHFDAHLKKFTFRPASRWRGLNEKKVFAFVGDYEREYKERLVALLRSKKKLDKAGFDMEPLEVLRDMLRDRTFDMIGGAPQIMKVYKYASCRPYAVFWPDRESKQVNLLGRPLLDYELSDYFVLDTDTLETVKHLKAARPPSAEGSSLAS